MVQFIYPLQHDYDWKLQGQGAILCFQGEKPMACFLVSGTTAVDLESFAKMIEAGWQFKLIGAAAFRAAFVAKINELGHTVMKEIDRVGDFELVYSSKEDKFRVSADGVKVKAQKIEKSEPSPKPQADAPVKVLVVDDSKTVRDLLVKILKSDPGVEVIGAVDLPSKVEPFIESHRPDVITLDIHMPEMDGVQLLRKILPKYRIPTIMISSLSEEDGPYVFDALELGAFDYIKKPSFQEIAQVGAFILERIKLAGKLGARRSSRTAFAPRPAGSAPPVSGESWAHSDKLLMIGSSTGGTEALRELFHQFPAEIPPTLVVQHIPPVFSKALAERLDSLFAFEVREAQDGDLVTPNRVLIAPGGKQMALKQKGTELKVVINDDAPVNRHKPSVDYLFESAWNLKQGSSIVGVILTGMGSDGARGLKGLRDRGAYTIGQDEESCVVYGMPKAAYEMGAVQDVRPLSKIGQAIGQHLSGGSRKTRAS